MNAKTTTIERFEKFVGDVRQLVIDGEGNPFLPIHLELRRLVERLDSGNERLSDRLLDIERERLASTLRSRDLIEQQERSSRARIAELEREIASEAERKPVPVFVTCADDFDDEPIGCRVQ